MSKFEIAKVVSSLPGTLVADSLYLVRTGVGFDLYASDATGAVAHKLNSYGADWTASSGPTAIANKPAVIAAGADKTTARVSVGITVSATEPTSPAPGDLWIN